MSKKSDIGIIPFSLKGVVMQKNYKILSFVIVLVMSLTIAGCSNNIKIVRRRRTDNKNIITDKSRLSACS